MRTEELEERKLGGKTDVRMGNKQASYSLDTFRHQHNFKPIGST